MKKCLYCTGEVPDEALKCKHCGEWLQEPGRAIAPAREQPLIPHVEPTELQKKVIRSGLLVFAGISGTCALFIFLGMFFGWLPEWKPSVTPIPKQQKQLPREFDEVGKPAPER